MSEVDEPVIPAADDADPGDEAAQQAEAQRATDETEARRGGWRPKDEFPGDPTRWVDAAEFNRRGRDHVPILRDKVKRLEARVTDLLDANKQFGEYQKQTRDAERKRLQSEIDGLKAQQLAAVTAGDTSAYLQTDQAIKARTDAMPKEPEVTAPQRETAAPEIQEFVGRNEWFRKDRTLNTVATAIHGELLESEPHLTLSENLERVEREVKRRFPEKFGNPNRQRPAIVDGAPAIGSGGRPRAKGYSDLPKEAKDACDKFVRTIPGYTREKYVADYAWE